MKITKDEFIKILKANADRFNREDIVPTDKLDDLGVDSIGFVMTIYAIEEKLKLKIKDEDLSVLTPDSLVADFIRVLAGLGIEIEI